MKIYSYEDAIDEIAERKLDAEKELDAEDYCLNMKIGDDEYYYVVFLEDGGSNIKIFRDVFYGIDHPDTDIRQTGLEYAFEKAVDNRIESLKEASRWSNFEDTFTDSDYFMQTVGFTGYAY